MIREPARWREDMEGYLSPGQGSHKEPCIRPQPHLPLQGSKGLAINLLV
jgi:hypothetical protein